MDAGAAADGFESLSRDARQRLMLLAGIALGNFGLETVAGLAAGSLSLRADALGFLAMGLMLADGLWSAGRPARVQAGATLARLAVLLVAGAWVAVTTLYGFFGHEVPVPEVMGSFGVVALAATGVSLYLLLPVRSDAGLVRRTWLQVRNGGIGNIAVMAAAGLVAMLGSGAPDLLLAGVMVALFLSAVAPPALLAWRGWQAVQAASSEAGSGPEQDEATPEPHEGQR